MSKPHELSNFIRSIADLWDAEKELVRLLREVTRSATKEIGA